MMQKWKLISKKKIYENEFMKLTEDSVVDPSGNKTIRNCIQVGGGSVVIVPVLSKNKFILVGQHRYAVNEYSWEFPSGGIIKNETPKKAAERELGEELGFEAKQLNQMLTFHPNNSMMDRSVYVFVAEELNRVENYEKDEYEKIEVKEISKKELLHDIKQGKIKDAFTICALLGYLINEGTI